MGNKVKISSIVAIYIAFFFVFLFKPAFPQDLSYHAFADVSTVWNIPHFFDVTSNLGLLVVGLWGLFAVLRMDDRLLGRTSWIVFYIGIVLTAPGSAYYHWEPNNQTLVWDRLPMSVGFMALYMTLLLEHIDSKLEKFLLPSVLLGIASVLVWAYFDDLRFYFLVQFGTFLSIPCILILFKSPLGKRWGYVGCFFFYLLAKITEVFDHKISLATNSLLTGHTLKHLLAGVGITCLVLMLKARDRVTVD